MGYFVIRVMKGFSSKEERGALESEMWEDEITATCGLKHAAEFPFPSVSPKYQKEVGGLPVVIFWGVLVIRVPTGSRHFVWGRGEAPLPVSFCSWAAALLRLLRIVFRLLRATWASRCLHKPVLPESSPWRSLAIVSLAIIICLSPGMESYSSRSWLSHGARHKAPSGLLPAWYISHICFLLPSHLCVWFLFFFFSWK